MSLCSWEMCPPILLKWWTKCKECMPGRTTWTSGPSTAPKKVGFFFVVLVGHTHVVFGPMWDLMCIVHLVIFLHVAMICLIMFSQIKLCFIIKYLHTVCFKLGVHFTKLRSTQRMNSLKALDKGKCILFIHELDIDKKAYLWINNLLEKVYVVS